MDTARKGDRAVVIGIPPGCTASHLNGREVEVLSDPYPYCDGVCTAPMNDTDADGYNSLSIPMGAIPTDNLLPIRDPDKSIRDAATALLADGVPA